MTEWGTILLTAVTVTGLVMLGLLIYWRKNGERYESRNSLDAMRRRVDELTIRVAELELLYSQARIYIAQLSALMSELGIELPSPPVSLQRRTEEQPTLVQIKRLLETRFSKDELKDLAFEAGFPPDSYTGETTAALSLSIVQYALRRGKVAALLEACRKARPETEWPDIVEGAQAPEL